LARQSGINFIHFDFDHKPDVKINGGNRLVVNVQEPILGRDLELPADLLVLSTPIVAPKGTNELATSLKIPIDLDGFFLEAHTKLRPVDFSADGIFMAGMAHYPKLLDETIAQAQAAASRAARILTQETMLTNARVAVVDPNKCVGCLTCVRICPFGVPVIKPDVSGAGAILGAAYIEATICQGCGICVSECPAQALQLMHYTDRQLSAKVSALVHDPAGFIPLTEIKGAGA
jgi:heterodisulfide reductase subunit A-like polyferredoxin